MIIKSFNIRHKLDFVPKQFDFDENLMFFYSKVNSTGKTTFLRSLLYSLGFKIPSTKKVDFKNYEFDITLERSNQIINIKRIDQLIWINNESYNVEIDNNKIMSIVFGISNNDLINSLLSILYIDQDNGWTMLNRGKMIGENNFNIDAFLRGLNDKDVSCLVEKNKNIIEMENKYKLMQNVKIYQEQIKNYDNNLTLGVYDETLENEIASLKNKINILNNQIRNLKYTKNSNDKFGKYIENLGIQVTIDGKNHIIKKEHLTNFKDIDTINQLRINELTLKRDNLKKELSLKETKRKNNNLIDIDTSLEQFNSIVRKAEIDMIQVTKVIGELDKEKKELQRKIEEITKKDNEWVNKLIDKIKKNWDKLQIGIEFKPDMIFLKNTQSFSGAILYKMVIAYKLAYISLLQEKTGITFPVFIDSPSGKEVEQKTIEKVLGMIKNNFKNNQLFICSIFKYNSVKIKDGQVLDFGKINAFDRHNLFDEL